ncbi:MAG: amidohydrolase family protein [Ignisphaera sp.]
MDIVVKRCRYVVKSFKPLHIVENSSIVIDGETISCVGECKDIHGYEILECGDSIAMPGFVSSHTHVLPSNVDGNVDDVVREALATLLKHGFTAIHIADEQHADLLCDKANEMGLRISIGPLISSEDDLKKLYMAKNLRRGLCIPAINIRLTENTNNNVLSLVNDFASRNNINIQVVMPQKISDVLAYYKKKGEWIVKHLAKTGLLTKRTCLAHFSWATTWEIEELMQSEANISIVPYTDSMAGILGSVHPQLFKLKRISIGIDDIWKRIGTSILYDIIALQTVYSAKTWGLYPQTEDVLHYSTRGGAQALNIDAGIIEIGKQADIAIFEINRHEVQRDMVSTILNSIHIAKYTIVNGKIACNTANNRIGEAKLKNPPKTKEVSTATTKT